MKATIAIPIANTLMIPRKITLMAVIYHPPVFSDIAHKLIFFSFSLFCYVMILKLESRQVAHPYGTDYILSI